MNPKEQAIKDRLAEYMPATAVDMAFALMQQYKLYVKVVAPRKTRLGQFAVKLAPNARPVLSINSDLSPYQFLITFIHEVGHFVVWQEHGVNVKPHGVEWQRAYANLLTPFIKPDIFPKDVLLALEQHIVRPGASSCQDAVLEQALAKYDSRTKTLNLVLVESLAAGVHFVLDGHTFQKGKILRTFCICVDVVSKKQYRVRLNALVLPIAH